MIKARDLGKTSVLATDAYGVSPTMVLLPAIQEWNRKHKERPPTLEEIAPVMHLIWEEEANDCGCSAIA